jgi:hypothetical protein
LSGQGAGYDPAVGIRVDHTTGRYADFLALHASGRVDLRKKYGAAEGATYSALVALRGYVGAIEIMGNLGRVYLSAGAGACGYRSEFSDGSAWSKHAVHPVAGLGWDSDRVDIDLSYYGEEHSTPNAVQAAKVTGAAKVYGDWKMLIELTGMRYLQGGAREQELLVTSGAGYEW